MTFWPRYEIIVVKDERRLWKSIRKSAKKKVNDIVSGIERPENIMCRLRLFYECSDGSMGFAEHVMRYEDDIVGFIKHWKTGGRMVITEHIDLV